MRRAAAWLAFAFAAAPAGATTGPDDLDGGVLDRGLPGLEEFSGFIVDRTITHFGAEFARAFAAAWRTQPAVQAVDLAIVERPSARFGSVVYVEYRQRAVARVFLYAGRGASIRPLAASAAEYVAAQAADDALARLLTSDPDMAKDELQ